MTIATQLFQGERIYLGPIDHEKDPEIESRWTHDPDYLRSLVFKIAKPYSTAKMKKKYEAIEKEVEESKNTFYFTIRKKEDDRLLGFVRIYWIEWSSGVGILEMAIGDPEDRRQGYATESLNLILRYAFSEANLHRLSAFVAADNTAAIGLFQKFGFTEEVRRRESIQRDGYTCDLIIYGLLSQEWKQS